MTAWPTSSAGRPAAVRDPGRRDRTARRRGPGPRRRRSCSSRRRPPGARADGRRGPVGDGRDARGGPRRAPRRRLAGGRRRGSSRRARRRSCVPWSRRPWLRLASLDRGLRRIHADVCLDAGQLGEGYGPDRGRGRGDDAAGPDRGDPGGPDLHGEGARRAHRRRPRRALGWPAGRVLARRRDAGPVRAARRRPVSGDGPTVPWSAIPRRPFPSSSGGLRTGRSRSPRPAARPPGSPSTRRIGSNRKTISPSKPAFVRIATLCWSDSLVLEHEREGGAGRHVQLGGVELAGVGRTGRRRRVGSSGRPWPRCRRRSRRARAPQRSRWRAAGIGGQKGARNGGLLEGGRKALGGFPAWGILAWINVERRTGR